MGNISFSNLLHEKHYNLPITVKCFISGKSVSPYSVPKIIKISCSGKIDKKCMGQDQCEYRNNTIDLSENKIHLLKFIDIPNSKFHGILADIFKIGCKFKFEVKEVQNVERIFITAPTGKERIKNVGNHVCYNLGIGLDVNTVYELDGFSTTDPNTQEGTCIFISSKKLKSDVETFSLTKKIHNQLNEFIVERPTPEKIFCKLSDLYTYYAHNVTKIYGRFHLHLAIDLVFRSVMSFSFGNDKVHKGWMDIMVIGDTRCGKGYVAERLIKYFNIGETISGDNTSYSGLVGGIDTYGNHRVISWGKIPINDQGLVVVDEAGEIKPDVWNKLSRVRSEGVAEVVKIQKQITNARTRLIFLANPPLKTISSYSYGIQSVMDVVKAPEDVARFDFVLVVSHDEVTVEEVNMERKEVADIYNSELEQSLIMWTWSRKSNQIIFDSKAVDEIFRSSIELAKEYSFSIPLVQGENIRIKLAKIAVCFASRLYSNREDGKILFIEKVHVDCARIFLNMIYKQESSGYHAMSAMQKVVDIGANKKDLEVIDKYFNAFTNSKRRLLKCLLNNNYVTTQDLMEQINIPRETSTEIVSKLVDLNLIMKKHHGTYIKNPSFTSWLKRKVLGENKIDFGGHQ